MQQSALAVVPWGQYGLAWLWLGLTGWEQDGISHPFCFVFVSFDFSSLLSFVLYRFFFLLVCVWVFRFSFCFCFVARGKREMRRGRGRAELVRACCVGKGFFKAGGERGKVKWRGCSLIRKGKCFDVLMTRE